MTWHAIFELRILIVLSSGQLSWVEHFPTLETAVVRFDQAVANVRDSLGVCRSFETSNGNEISGVVRRGVIEIAKGSTDGTRRADMAVLPKYAVVVDPPKPPAPGEDDASEAHAEPAS